MYTKILKWLLYLIIKQLSKRVSKTELGTKISALFGIKPDEKLKEALSKYAEHSNWSQTDYDEYRGPIGKYDYWDLDEDGWKTAEEVLK